MSAWKLVEAVPDQAPVENNVAKDSNATGQTSDNRNASNGRGGGRGSRDGGRGGRGRGNRPQMTKADRTYTAYMAVQQIELIFTSDNLCMDTYIRAYMDEAGYVPISLVCGYPHVSYCGAIYSDIVSRLKELGESSVIEIDADNETIRLKEGWDMWLMPNATGGRGQPLYVKQASAPKTHHNNQHRNSNHKSDKDQQQRKEPQQSFDSNTVNWPTLSEQMQQS